jgi:hypothetical protein
MGGEELLNLVTIPTPCPMDWDLMRGDDRVRFCAGCNKHVYNLSAMTSAEMVALIRTHGGDFCGQIYQRLDGTIVTAGCRRPEARQGGLQYHLRSLMAIIAAIAAALGLTRLLAEGQPAPPPKPVPPPPIRLGGKVCIPRAVMRVIDDTTSDRFA